MEGARYLEDGKLTVFRRAGIYYARLRLAGSAKYITRSLKTSNEQTAVDLGRRLLFQLEQRSEAGLPPKSKLFAAVIDDYIAYRERDHRHGKTSDGMLRQIVRVSKFWREYAGRLAVEAIDDKVMREFIPWRRDYYASFDKLPKNAKRHPTDKTLQWDMMLGKAIVKWAAEQGLRGKQPAITVTFTPKKKRVRPAFERWEYRLLWRTLCKRIKTARDKRTKASRELLRVYVLVLANSGIRTGEDNKGLWTNRVSGQVTFIGDWVAITPKGFSTPLKVARSYCVWCRYLMKTRVRDQVFAAILRHKLALGELIDNIADNKNDRLTCAVV